MTFSEGDKRWMKVALKANGITDTNGLRIALAPVGGDDVDLVLMPQGVVLATYELEEGETIGALAEALQELLVGSDVRAPSA